MDGIGISRRASCERRIKPPPRRLRTSSHFLNDNLTRRRQRIHAPKPRGKRKTQRSSFMSSAPVIFGRQPREGGRREVSRGCLVSRLPPAARLVTRDG